MRYFKDYFLTDDFLIRGHVSTGSGRLSTFLNGADRHLVEIADATCTRMHGKSVHTARAVLPLSEVLLAYEAFDAGDEALRALARQSADTIEVSVHLSSHLQLKVIGRLRRNIYEHDKLGPHAFIVITQPYLSAGDGAQSVMERFPEQPPYLILNRNRIALIHS
jgi:hypothetical protein